MHLPFACNGSTSGSNMASQPYLHMYSRQICLDLQAAQSNNLELTLDKVC